MSGYDSWATTKGLTPEHEAFIQWKGTKVCMDFVCLACGRDLHVDGEFAYSVECLECGAIHEMHAMVGYRRNDDMAPGCDGVYDAESPSTVPYQHGLGWPRGETDLQRCERWMAR